MSALKQKSEFNILAADILKSKVLYAPSVHCSYYSCFQLMKYSIKKLLKIEYDELSDMIATSNTNTHNFVINLIAKEIKNKFGNIPYRNFSNNIKDLKKFRVDSDYHNIEVNISHSQEAYNIANEVLKQIKNL